MFDIYHKSIGRKVGYGTVGRVVGGGTKARSDELGALEVGRGVALMLYTTNKEKEA